jgi:hypothetical protein
MLEPINQKVRKFGGLINFYIALRIEPETRPFRDVLSSILCGMSGSQIPSFK